MKFSMKKFLKNKIWSSESTLNCRSLQLCIKLTHRTRVVWEARTFYNGLIRLPDTVIVTVDKYTSSNQIQPNFLQKLQPLFGSILHFNTEPLKIYLVMVMNLPLKKLASFIRSSGWIKPILGHMATEWTYVNLT